MKDSVDLSVGAASQAERSHALVARFKVMTAGFCALMAAISVFVLLVASSNWPPDGPSKAALLGVALGAIVLLALAWGLVWDTAWSIPLAVLWLYWLVLIGIIDVVAAFSHGGITVPLGTIAALFDPHATPPRCAPCPRWT